MRLVALILITLIAVSCASKNSKKTYTFNGKEVPSWIYEVEEQCPEGSICTVGEGSSFESADKKAIASLASVFESQVRSQFDIFNSSLSEGEVEQVKKSIRSEVSITVNNVVMGAKIKEHYEQDKTYFSYVVLDKQRSASIFIAEVKKIDDELQFLYDKKSRTSILRMLSLVDRRAVLEDKLIILGRKARLQDITFSKIQSLKYIAGENKALYIKSTNAVPRTVEKFLSDLLNQVGYKITEDSNSQNFSVEISYTAKEEYLNVKGFSKYSFNIQVFSKNREKKQIGSIVHSFVESGRNQQDAYLKAKEKIQKYLKNNLEKLNLD